MYAVIKTGGKQYLVSEGMRLRIEKLKGEKGDSIKVGDVLLVGGEGSPKIGTPVIEGANVTAEVMNQRKDKKVIVYKKKRRTGYEKRYGHRQQYTEVTITKINA